MYAFFAVVLAIITALGLALLIGIVIALREGAGTPETLMTRNEARRIAANMAKLTELLARLCHATRIVQMLGPARTMMLLRF